MSDPLSFSASSPSLIPASSLPPISPPRQAPPSLPATAPSLPRPYLVFPRKRKLSSDPDKPHVVPLTYPDILALLHLRQSEAAATLGISLTAFKNACKALGVRSWRSRSPSSRATSAGRTVTAESDDSQGDGSEPGSSMPSDREKGNEVYRTQSSDESEEEDERLSSVRQDEEAWCAWYSSFPVDEECVSDERAVCYKMDKILEQYSSQKR